MNSNTPKINDEVIFFLGAGASVPAGIPDTKKFVSKFKEEKIDKGKKEMQETFKWIMNNLKKSKEKIDIEKILESVSRLNPNNVEEETLSLFLQKPRELASYSEVIPDIEKELRQYIRDKVIVPESKIGYLDQLKDFVDEYGILDVFSVNYDVCIELFCKRNSLRYQDGFELNWNMDLFGHKCHINLYKLHGSVIWWYNKDIETYVKLPIVAKEGKSLELFSGEKLENLLMYPLETKFSFSRPISDLTFLLREKLKKVKLCVVVGYTFRDDYIKKIFIEAGESNRDLRVLLIDPQAGEIYKEHFGGTSLKDKIGLLNLYFEEVLTNHWLIKQIRDLSTPIYRENEARKASRIGNKGLAMNQFRISATRFAELGFVFDADRILSKDIELEYLSYPKADDNEIIELYFTLAHLYLESSIFDKSKIYIKKVSEIIKSSINWGDTYIQIRKEQGIVKRAQGKPFEGLEEEEKELLGKEGEKEYKLEDAQLLRNVKKDHRLESTHKLTDELSVSPTSEGMYWQDSWFKKHLLPIKEVLENRSSFKSNLRGKYNGLLSSLLSDIKEVSSFYETARKDIIPLPERVKKVRNKVNGMLKKLDSLGKIKSN